MWTSSEQTLFEIRDDLQATAAELQKRDTEGLIGAFAGDVKSVPGYASWLMQQYGDIRALHLREVKQPIGRPEADALLKLKVKRGGTTKLDNIQQTVHSLLGVSMDAFEAEGAQPAPRGEGGVAEMDIDDFLAEANGAGIREALRLILDLELRQPELAMIEEPEVHLHPGLERAVETYLREKSRTIQMFVTTHSTHFVDSASFQNIYLVSRGAGRRTAVEPVGADDGAFRIPAELGLRLSALFMFDQLVFLEGPSDEAVLRELARTLRIDIAKANAGFVQMGGVKSFAHYAAERTLDLLSRRRVRLWFVVDRDEADDAEVRQMVNRLGARASLRVLPRRELENYLLDPAAIARFVQEKRLAAGAPDTSAPASADVVTAIGAAATELREELIRLRLEKRVLCPIYLQNRQAAQGSPDERIRAAMADLQERLDTLDAQGQAVAAAVDEDLRLRALEVVPGSKIIERVAEGFGVRFRKDVGDSAKIARHVARENVPADLRLFLEEVSRGNAN